MTGTGTYAAASRGGPRLLVAHSRRCVLAARAPEERCTGLADSPRLGLGAMGRHWAGGHSTTSAAALCEAPGGEAVARCAASA